MDRLISTGIWLYDTIWTMLRVNWSGIRIGSDLKSHKRSLDESSADRQVISSYASVCKIVVWYICKTPDACSAFARTCAIPETHTSPILATNNSRVDAAVISQAHFAFAFVVTATASRRIEQPTRPPFLIRRPRAS